MVLLLPSGWDFGKGMLEVSLLLRVRTLLRMKCCFFFYSLRKWGPGVVLALVLDAGRSFREAAIKQRLFGNPSRTKTQSLQFTVSVRGFTYVLFGVLYLEVFD